MHGAKAKVKVPAKAPSKSMCKKVNTCLGPSARPACPYNPIQSRPALQLQSAAIHSTMKSEWMMGEMKMEFLMSCCCCCRGGKGQTSPSPACLAENNGDETKRWGRTRHRVFGRTKAAAAVKWESVCSPHPTKSLANTLKDIAVPTKMLLCVKYQFEFIG